MLLEEGNVVSGDAHLIESNQLQCDESALTGESLPSQKNIHSTSKETVLGDQLNMVFKGTSVMKGNGKAVITGISHNSQLGIITSLVDSSKEQATPLDIKIASLSKMLIWITLVMTTVFAITGFVQGKNWMLILETSIALAVAAFPEGLPIVVTVALAYRTLLMAKKNVIVKKMSVVETLGGYIVSAKGSVEHLLEKCTKVQVDSRIVDLNENSKKKILAESEKLATEGLRVLAFAYRNDNQIDTKNFFNSLVHVGMIGFLDPPRMDIKDAIQSCKKAGIKIVMITGDHPMTALNIAKKVGLVDASEINVLNGKDLPQLESMTGEWTQKILSTAIFARVTPKQKLDIVSIYQKAGNIVAMTGDGVNDAPAIKKADIGIAMGFRGTQVAKETASIVLKDDSFVSIAASVSQGREIYQNIQKFVIYLVSCNLSEILIVILLGFLAPATILLPLQILYLNMVTDIFPALALGLGTGDHTVMENPPRSSDSEIVSGRDWIAISFYTASMVVAVLVAVLYCKYVLMVGDKIINNVAFVTLAFAQLFHVFNMSALHAKIFINNITRNKFVWFALLLCTSLMVFVFALPQMRLALKLEVLPTKILVLSLLASLFPLVSIQLYKLIRKMG